MEIKANEIEADGLKPEERTVREISVRLAPTNNHGMFSSSPKTLG